MIFDQIALSSSRRKLNKSLSRAENNSLWKLIQPSDCLVSGVACFLPHIDAPLQENCRGILCLLSRSDEQYDVKFFDLSRVHSPCLWELEVSVDTKVDHPRPDLLVIESTSHSNIFKFSCSDEATDFSALLTLKIAQIRKLTASIAITKDDIGLPLNFRTLDIGAWNTVRQLQGSHGLKEPPKSRWKPKISLNGFRKMRLNTIQKPSFSKISEGRGLLRSLSNAVARKVSVNSAPLAAKKELEETDDKCPLL